jgi:hypothetical protein
VYTDSTDPTLRTFVDYNPKWTNYPFYSYSNYFYDAPLWTYSLLNKPLSFWTGHAFAVSVDHQKKLINCIGGIKWGFELSQMKLRPNAIHPQLLDKRDWEKAWNILQEKLQDYKQTSEF